MIPTVPTWTISNPLPARPWAKRTRLLSLAGLLLIAVGPLQAGVLPQAAPAAPQPAGCTLTNHGYTCSRIVFQRSLTSAKTVSIEIRSTDLNGRAQLEALAADLGKSVTGPGQASDLIFALVPADMDGVKIGPAHSPLATLSVYASGAEGTHGRLIWSETYTGAADMRWPAIVHALIEQFRAEFDKH